jgi:hypothetical protein
MAGKVGQLGKTRKGASLRGARRGFMMRANHLAGAD